MRPNAHHDHRRKCPSRKLRYRSESDAKAAITSSHSAPQRAVMPTRAYFHVECNGWHLTSQPESSTYRDHTDTRHGWRQPQTWDDLMAAVNARQAS